MFSYLTGDVVAYDKTVGQDERRILTVHNVASPFRHDPEIIQKKKSDQ